MKNQIGYCGIWCGDCLGGNGAIIKLTKKYEELIIKSKPALERYAPKEFNYNELLKELAYIQDTPQCPGCRNGGGDSNCKIRDCAIKRNIDNCGNCDTLMDCNKYEELEKCNPDLKKEMLKYKNFDKNDILMEKMKKLKTKWPHCILVCENTN